MFTIQRNIPFPTRIRGSKYPVQKLNVGESFFVSKEEAKQATVSACCKRMANRSNFKITIRRVDEDGVEGVRVWRVA